MHTPGPALWKDQRGPGHNKQRSNIQKLHGPDARHQRLSSHHPRKLLIPLPSPGRGSQLLPSPQGERARVRGINSFVGPVTVPAKKGGLGIRTVYNKCKD